MAMQRVTPFLWFDKEAADAAKFYASVFKNAKAGLVTHYGEKAQMPAGTVLTATFTIDGQEFIAEPGDAWIHPRGVPHYSEALEDCVQVEVKSPPRKTWVSKE